MSLFGELGSSTSSAGTSACGGGETGGTSGAAGGGGGGGASAGVGGGIVVVEKMRVVVVVDQLQNPKAPQPRVHLRLRLHPSPGAAHESGVKGRTFALMLRGR